MYYMNVVVLMCVKGVMTGAVMAGVLQNRNWDL
jgi:hypothetical protein